MAYRVLGVLIIACGLAVCYGAVELWPVPVQPSIAGVLRIVGATIAAIVGVANVIAGLAVLMIKLDNEKRA